MPASDPIYVTTHLFSTGYCLASESHILRGGDHRTIHCHALVALIQHPQHGWLLWDTGYAAHMLAAVRRWPYNLYALATPLRIDPAQAAMHQVQRFGARPADIGIIVLSHFHADHIAGLRDFPQARIMATPEAFQEVAHRQGLSALRRAFIPELLPTDFQDRFDPLTGFDGPDLPGLGRACDLFQDGSLLVVRLPGHACGQVGLLARTPQGSQFFAADAAWVTQAIRTPRPPSRLASLILHDPAAAARTLAALQRFTQARPEVEIIPTHCPEVAARYFPK